MQGRAISHRVPGQSRLHFGDPLLQRLSDNSKWGEAAALMSIPNGAAGAPRLSAHTQQVLAIGCVVSYTVAGLLQGGESVRVGQAIRRSPRKVSVLTMTQGHSLPNSWCVISAQ